MTRRYTTRDHQRDRPGEGHPGAGRRHRRLGDGVDLRHVLDEQGPLGARRRHRQAADDRRLARPRGGDRARRALLHPRRAARSRTARSPACASPSRASATSAASSRSSCTRKARRSSRSPTRPAASTTRRASTSPAAFAHKHEHRTLAGLAGRRADHERGAAAPRLRRARAVRARAGDHRATTPTRCKATIICEGANGPVTPAADEILEDKGVLDPPRRARERGRRRRLVLRVGAGPPGVLLEGGRGEREAERHRQPRVRRDLGDARRSATCRCAWPPTASPSSASPRRR